MNLPDANDQLLFAFNWFSGYSFLLDYRPDEVKHVL